MSDEEQEPRVQGGSMEFASIEQAGISTDGESLGIKVLDDDGDPYMLMFPKVQLDRLWGILRTLVERVQTATQGDGAILTRSPRNWMITSNDATPGQFALVIDYGTIDAMVITLPDSQGPLIAAAIHKNIRERADDKNRAHRIMQGKPKLILPGDKGFKQ